MCQKRTENVFCYGESMIVEKVSSTVSKKYDFVKISYMLASYVPIPFWIIIYNLDLLPVLFPSYKGKDMATPMLFAPGFIALFSVSIMYMCRYAILKIEKDYFSSAGLLIEPPLNDLFFDYIKKESYGKLFLVIACWLFNFIAMAAKTTMFFGVFIAFKYIHN